MATATIGVSDVTIGRLADGALRIAVRAAADVYKARGLGMDDITADRLVPAIHASVKAAMSQAIDDARQAYECGMHQAGDATFAASMALAGIQAAEWAIDNDW